MTDIQQQRLNTIIGKSNGGINVVSPVATVPVEQDFDTRYDNAMADLELKQKVDSLYKSTFRL